MCPQCEPSCPPRGSVTAFTRLLDHRRGSWHDRIQALICTGIAVLSVGGVAAAASAAFPGDNGRIVFSSTRSGSNEIYAMDVRGTGSGVSPGHAPRTPTGDRARRPLDRLRALQPPRQSGTREIYLTTVAGRKVRRLTRNAWDDAAPAWAPDGRRIVFRSDMDGDPEIYVMNRDGSGVVQLTFNDLVADDDPQFSPDGSRIAFLSRRDGNSEIYVMNADGAAPAG